ncbi:hypothetical protein GQ42DRAFT_78886 [Ramicandelaber brevisporus]|nr:hypothetical protein GQ42DRAFT_78886 [Ramicandelaber brevisporus]
MSSYNSMRRQLCAYSFYAIEPHTMPPSELPDGLELNPKSRVWFHVHFYRGATSWRNVPRTVLTKRRQVARQSQQPSPAAASLENTATRELDSRRRAAIRKSALTYRDALVEIERNTQPAVERVTSSSSSSSSSSPLTKTDSSPSSPLSLSSLPSPAMSTTVSPPMHSLRPLPTTPTHVNKANKMSLSFILNSPPRYDPY